MKNYISYFLLIISLMLSSTLFGQYQIQKYVIGSGVTISNSAEHKLINTLGQPMVGNSSSQLHNCLSGFWNSVMSTVGVNDLENMPTKFELFQNYPNPFNPTTTIRYSIPTPLNPPFNKGGTTGGFVTLKVYDILGNEIATLVNAEKNPGTYEVQFSTSEYHLSSGIYFYRLTAGNFVDTKKIILLK
jgi:hypothetical protein